jgi:hypothetical protein
MSKVTGPGQGVTMQSQPQAVQAVRAEVQNEPATTVADQYVRVRDGQGEGRLLFHASRRIDALGPGIERLLVVVHGALRDSDRYFDHARRAAAAGEASSFALIVAPQFLADVDHAARAVAPVGTLYWGVEGWKGGEPALGPAQISSFTAMDCLLQELTAPNRLRDSKKRDSKKLVVVIVGNSAGGQFVNRYAAVGQAPDVLAQRGIPVRFIIANPSTYLYFDHARPVKVPDGTGINRWRYGFDEAPAYVKDTPEQSLRRYLERDVTIVLGAEDRQADALLLEVGAAAMAQGANRFERGINYDQYVRQRALEVGLAVNHQVIKLAGVGHAAGEVLVAEQTREIMFG